MTPALCAACGERMVVPHLKVACRFCGQRKLRRGAPPPRAKVQQRVPFEKLPPESQKLRKFMADMGWTDAELARRLQGLGLRCSRQLISRMIIQGGPVGWDTARAIANIMRQRGYTPAEFWPYAARQDLPKPDVRHDFRAWAKRQTEEGRGRRKPRLIDPEVQRHSFRTRPRFGDDTSEESGD
jgi:hypothetical protein